MRHSMTRNTQWNIDNKIYELAAPSTDSKNETKWKGNDALDFEGFPTVLLSN